MTSWNSDIRSCPEEAYVMTCIRDSDGERNITPLKRSGSLFFGRPDAHGSSMYVYYRPTHWRQMTSEERAKFDIKPGR